MIQQVKPIMRGLRKNWHKQVMTKLMCNMALNRLAACQMQVKDPVGIGDDGSIEGTEESSAGGAGALYKCYARAVAVLTAFHQNVSLSIVILNDGCYGCIVERGAQ